MISGKKINSILLQLRNSFAYQIIIKNKNLTLIVDWLSWLSEKKNKLNSDYENASLKSKK